MKKILVTGADGFIGSHLVEALVNRGESVRALCQYNSFGGFGWLDDSPFLKDIDVVMGDVRDAAQMCSICCGIDSVFHLAALIAIPYSYSAPASYIDTNVSGTLNLLQAALASDVSRFIHTSTSEVYGTAKIVPIREDHPLQAQSPYSASKIAADALAYSFYSSFDLPIIIARPFNTYGPRQSARAIIPTVISQLLAGSKSLKLGSLSPLRDFNYVLDTCLGLISLENCDAAIGQSINIGSGIEISIGDMVSLIQATIGVQVEIHCDEGRIRPLNSEVERLICDNSLLKSLTGFEPLFDLKTGLYHTIDWFRNPSNLKRYKVELFNV